MTIDDSNPVSRWSPQPLTHFVSPRPGLVAHVEFGAESRSGRMRPVNEDHYWVVRVGRHQETILTNLPDAATPERFDEFAYAMIVADGIGDSGAVASRLAIKTLAQLTVDFGKWNVRIDEPTAQDVMEQAERFYKGVDAMLVQAGRFGPRGLETTLTGVYSAGTDLFFVHVGHSRAYLCRDGALLQLTHDHTLAKDRPRRAALVDVTDTAQDVQHTVTETIGRGKSVGPRIDIERCALVDGDVVLLCTNGLTDIVDEGVIATTLGSHDSPATQARALVDIAADLEGIDDVTALVARYRFGGPA
jgi:protein phosphatase